MERCNACGNWSDTFVIGKVKFETHYNPVKVAYCSACVEKIYAALQRRYAAQPKPELENGDVWESPSDES